MNSPVKPPASESDLPPDLPIGWALPREMAEVGPTLAPVLLAFGLAGATLGLLVSSRSVLALGVLVALLGAGMWAWDAYQQTRDPEAGNE